MRSSKACVCLSYVRFNMEKLPLRQGTSSDLSNCLAPSERARAGAERRNVATTCSLRMTFFWVLLAAG